MPGLMDSPVSAVILEIKANKESLVLSVPLAIVVTLARQANEENKVYQVQLDSPERLVG